MVVIIAIVKLIVILCIVATIHEFGHFIAAKLLKVGVNEFSIGFGPKIIQKKYKETMYSLRWVPLGGYVMIEGEGEESDKPNSFNRKNAFEKCIILSMGVIFNVILAFVILMTTAFTSPTLTTEIKELKNDSVLIEVGILPGDKITKINGDSVTLAADLFDTKYAERELTQIEYERNGIIHTVFINDAVKSIGYIGVGFLSNGTNGGTNKVDSVRPGKPAEKSGIKSGDLILKVNGTEVSSSTEIINLVQQNPNKNLELLIDRNGEVITKTIVPEMQEQFDLGIADVTSVKTNLVYAFDNSVKVITTVAGSYVDLFRGKVVLDDVSSIVGIGVVVSKTVDIVEYLNMLAIISLAIGVANILPFPPLDGGKILFVAIGAVTRKKIPLNVEAIVSFIGFGALILLTLVVTYKDIVRIF